MRAAVLLVYVSLILGTSSLRLRNEPLSLSKDLLTVLSRAETQLDDGATFPSKNYVQRNADSVDLIASGGRNGTSSEKARRACKVLGTYFGENVISPNSSSYVEAEEKSWSTTCWLPAACFVELHSPSDVIVALRVVAHVGSQFAVRNRGHNGNPGFSSIGDVGVLLDIGSLNATEVNSDATVISAGPGASWGSVYAALDPYNVSAIGGRDPNVGVSGLILGGGIPYFSAYTGLASANVKNFQVVLANSSLVNANSAENPDLFYALKGGGPNYGIITKVDLYTIPLHRVWYSLAVYKAEDHAVALAATARLHEFARNDTKLGFFLNVNPAGIFAGLLYADWTPWPTAFEPFQGLTPVATIANATNGTVLSLSKAIAGSPSPAIRRYGAGVTHRYDPSLYEPTYDTYVELSNSSDSFNGSLSYTIQPVGATVAGFQQKNGGSPFNIDPVDQDWIVAPISWNSAEYDEAAEGAVDTLISSVQADAAQSGDLQELVFMNDASGKQNPLRSYGTDILERLKSIAQAYDPEGVFQDLQYGGFKVSDA